MLTELENEIVERLKLIQLQNIVVQNIPALQSSYAKAYDNPTVTVSIASLKFDKDRTTGVPSLQDFTAEITCHIQSRAIRTHGNIVGIYEMYDEVRRALIGFKPTNFKNVYATGFEPLYFNENLLGYVATFACVGMYAQDNSFDCPQAPLLQETQFNNA